MPGVCVLAACSLILINAWSALVEVRDFCLIAISKQVWQKQCLLSHYYSSGEIATN